MSGRLLLNALTMAIVVCASTLSLEASARCDARENCTREGPKIPCPTIKKPGRMCRTYFDDPICLTRRTACQGELAACITSGLVSYGAGSTCIGCVAAGAITTGGAAAAACVGVCGIAAEGLEQVINRCGR